MKVTAKIISAPQIIEVRLTAEEQEQLARTFELGVNVGPDTPQTIVVVISTPGYEEE